VESEIEDDDIESFDEEETEDDEAVAVMLHSRQHTKPNANIAANLQFQAVSPSKRARPPHLSAFAAHIKRGRCESPDSSEESEEEGEDTIDIRIPRHQTAKSRTRSAIAKKVTFQAKRKSAVL